MALALVNYGHFTSMRVDDGRVRGLGLHLDRLERDCRTLFAADLDRAEVLAHVRRAVGGAGGSLVVRVTIHDPDLPLDRPGAPAAPKVLVTTRPVAGGPLPPLRLRSFVYSRDQPEVKHVGLFGALWHRRGAQLGGHDDALFTDADSFISEGPTWNVGFYDGEQVVWPVADVLPGVTMRLLQRFPAGPRHAPVNLADLPDMRAAFATSTAIGVRPIAAVDRFAFPADHPVIAALREEYAAIPGEPV